MNEMQNKIRTFNSQMRIFIFFHRTKNTYQTKKMSSSSQTNSSLASATYVLTYYGYSFMLIVGDIGNILNIVLFFQKKLRKTSCNNCK